VSRSPNSDDVISRYRVPAGALIILCSYTAHRNAQVWEQPDAFDPQRFTPECTAGRPRHAYWPFSMGPRMCIGNYLAVMEAQISIAMIAQSYQLRLPAGTVVEPQAGVTLRPHNGMPMTLQPRY
jgi:cytochrome P450